MTGTTMTTRARGSPWICEGCGAKILPSVDHACRAWDNEQRVRCVEALVAWWEREITAGRQPDPTGLARLILQDMRSALR